MTLPGRQEKLMYVSAWRYARQHPWQTWLSFAGIVLGVMMVVAVDLANTSAKRAFELSVEAVNGNITHQIVGGSEGVPDSIYTALRTELGIRRSAPGISGQVRLNGTAVTLIGMDLLSESSLARRRPGVDLPANIIASVFASVLLDDTSVLVSDSFASANDLTANQTITVASQNRTMQVQLAPFYSGEEQEATEGLMLADIALAQNLLGKAGRLDSVDLILNEGQAANLRNWLPPELTLVETENRNASLDQMTSAFHLNLQAMSLLSLLVASLLIYNTMTLSVIQRQQTLGIFRCQGVSRKQIFALILWESGLLGVLASVVGIIFGLLLGRALVKLVTRTINDLYFTLSVNSFLLDPLVLVKGLVLGVGMTLLAALLPALQATRCQPVTLRHRAVSDKQWQQRVPLLSVTGLVMIAVGYLLLQPLYGSLVAGFVALTLIVFGLCFWVPQLMTWLLNGILLVAGQRISLVSRMALRNIQSGISRTGLAVAALAVAVSVTVGIGIMIGSFRDTVILWLDQSVPGDVQVVSGDINSSEIGTRLQALLLEIDGIANISTTILRQIESEGGQLRLSVIDAPAEQSYFIKDANPENLQRFDSGQGVLVSEPLAYLRRLNIGDSFTLYTDQGAQAFPITGIFYDYTTSAGMVAVAPQLYRQYWNNQTISRLSVYLSDAEEQTRAEVIANMRQQLDSVEGEYFISVNRNIRASVLEIFDRTFAITKVLRLLAILVAFVGVLSAMMALQLERSREYALLRATGMTPGNIAGMIFSQTAFMGLMAGLMAIPLGLVMSEILIDVINQRSYGWSMLHSLPLAVLLEAVLLAIFAALLAGIYPARRIAVISPALALRQE